MPRDCCGQNSGLATATLDSQSSKSRTSLAPVTWASPSNLRAWLTASTVDTHVYVSPPPLASCCSSQHHTTHGWGMPCVPRACVCVCVRVRVCGAVRARTVPRPHLQNAEAQGCSTSVCVRQGRAHRRQGEVRGCRVDTQHPQTTVLCAPLTSPNVSHVAPPSVAHPLAGGIQQDLPRVARV